MCTKLAKTSQSNSSEVLLMKNYLILIIRDLYKIYYEIVMITSCIWNGKLQYTTDIKPLSTALLPGSFAVVSSSLAWCYFLQVWFLKSDDSVFLYQSSSTTLNCWLFYLFKTFDPSACGCDSVLVLLRMAWDGKFWAS